MNISPVTVAFSARQRPGSQRPHSAETYTLFESHLGIELRAIAITEGRCPTTVNCIIYGDVVAYIDAQEEGGAMESDDIGMQGAEDIPQAGAPAVTVTKPTGEKRGTAFLVCCFSSFTAAFTTISPYQKSR